MVLGSKILLCHSFVCIFLTVEKIQRRGFPVHLLLSYLSHNAGYMVAEFLPYRDFICSSLMFMHMPFLSITEMPEMQGKGFSSPFTPFLIVTFYQMQWTWCIYFI